MIEHTLQMRNWIADAWKILKGVMNMMEPNGLAEEKLNAAMRWVQLQESQLRQQGLDEQNMLSKFSNLAESYCTKEAEHLLAEALWLRSLEIMQQTDGENSLFVGLILKRLARYYRSQARYAEAESVIKRALSIGHQLFGADHPWVGTSLNDLGALYHRQGRYRTAEEYYLQALPIMRKLGDNHPDTQNTLQNFQELLRQVKRENRVSELSDHPFTQATLDKGLPEAQPQAVPPPTQLVVLQGLTGYSLPEREAAELWVKTVETGLRPRRNNDDLGVALGLNTAAEFCRSQGNHLHAEALWQRAVAIYLQPNRRPDANLAVIYNNLASFYRSQGCYSDAEFLFTEALSILSKTYENTDPLTKTVLNNFMKFLEQVVHENRVAELYNFEATQMLLRDIKPGK